MSDQRRQDLLYPPGPEAHREQDKGPRHRVAVTTSAGRLAARFCPLRHDEEALLRELRKLPRSDWHRAHDALFQTFGVPYLNVTRLYCADFGATKAPHADFSGADLVRAAIHDADLSACRFDGAKLARAEFFDCNLSHASFRNADLSGAVMADSDLTGAIFDGACLERAHLRDNRGAGTTS